MMDLLKQPIEKTHWVMGKWGYTGSPCVILSSSRKGLNMVNLALTKETNVHVQAYRQG
jgi:hypothetical protein